MTIKTVDKATYVWVCGRFEDEPESYNQHDHFAVKGLAQTQLSTLTDQLWNEYAYRQGHATSRYIPEKRALRLRRGVHVYTVDADWRAYRVYLNNDSTNTPLDQSKTLGELGLTEHRTWLRFERVI